MEEINNLIDSDKVLLNCDDIAPILQTNPHYLRQQAKEDPSKLGFPVIVCGCRVKIPRLPFLKFLGVIK